MSKKVICVERIIDTNYKLPKEITNRLDYVYLILMICRLLMNEDKEFIPSEIQRKKIIKSFLRVSIGKERRRAFIFLASNKFFSVFFPYRLKVDDKSGNVTVYYDNNKILTSAILSECIAFKEDMTDKKGINGKSVKGKSFKEVILDETYQDETYNLMSSLMTIEPCYVRYDHDLASRSRKIHPIDHFDINYDRLATFKLGLHSRLNTSSFVDFMLPDTTVYFCGKGTSKYYYKNISLKQRKKNKRR